MSKSHYIIPIFVPHEGCPHNCVFCNQETITGSHSIVDDTFVRETIEEYIKTIKNKDATIEVSFYGGTFTAIELTKQNELLKVAKEYKDKGIIDYIHLSTRPDYIDQKILDNLKNYSVDIIELGIQSMDDDVLIKSGRGHTREDAVYASKLIKKYNFILGLQVMLGLPGDNFQKDINTAIEIIKLSPDICRIYPSLVIKNTPMETMFKHGVYKPYSLDEAVDISKVIYSMFVSAGINVIRVGLQPTEEINIGKEIVEGPFHSAFRELVEGSIMNDLIGENLPNDSNIDVLAYVNPKDISKLYADGKRFFKDMLQHKRTKSFKVMADNQIQRNHIGLKLNSQYIILSINSYMEQKYKKGYLSEISNNKL